MDPASVRGRGIGSHHPIVNSSLEGIARQVREKHGRQLHFDQPFAGASQTQEWLTAVTDLAATALDFHDARHG